MPPLEFNPLGDLKAIRQPWMNTLLVHAIYEYYKTAIDVREAKARELRHSALSSSGDILQEKTP